MGDVLGIARSGPPGVVVVGRQAGDQPAARHQVERMECGRAPAARGRVGGLLMPGAGQQGHGIGDGQQHGGYRPTADVVLLSVASYHRDLGGLGRSPFVGTADRR